MFSFLIIFLAQGLIKSCSCTVRLTNLLSGINSSLTLLSGSNNTTAPTRTRSLSPPVEDDNDTHTHTPPISPFSCTAWGSCCAESCYSRWSPLFGNGPDHVTTKWWKLWAVCKLSISTERLGEKGNRQGTWKHIHALRRKRTEIPEPQQWWVDGFYSVEIKKKRDMFLYFFFLSQPADRKREWGRGCCHQHCGSEAAPPWRMHTTADAYSFILQGSSVSLYVYLCVHILYMFLWILSMMSSVQPFSIFFPLAAVKTITSPLFQAPEEEQGCVFFMRANTRDSLWICISAQSVLMRAWTHSIWISTRERQRGGGMGLSWCNQPCSSPLLPSSNPSASSPPPLVWMKGLFTGGVTFNLKIFLISLIPAPHHSCLYSPCSLITEEIYQFSKINTCQHILVFRASCTNAF